jgi:hypothetical protein
MAGIIRQRPRPGPKGPWSPVYHGGMRTTHLLYLHGFRSSPQSMKAQKMAAIVAQRHPAVHWWCPQLPPSPEAALRG